MKQAESMQYPGLHLDNRVNMKKYVASIKQIIIHVQ